MALSDSLTKVRYRAARAAKYDLEYEKQIRFNGIAAGLDANAETLYSSQYNYLEVN